MKLSDLVSKDKPKNPKSDSAVAQLEEEQLPKIREFLGEIDDKAGRGAVLGSLGALWGIRAIKVSQLQQQRIEALEKGQGLSKLEDLQAKVTIGDFEFDLQQLLELDEGFLGRVLNCVKETLENPAFGDALKKELGVQALPALVGIGEKEKGN